MIRGQSSLTTSGLTVMVMDPPQLSIACTRDAFGGGTPTEAQTVMSAAHRVMVGGVVSFTVMRCVAVAVLPQLSEAVQVRVMRLLQLEPGWLWLSWSTGVRAPPQLSLAATVAGAGTSPRHCTLRSLGTPPSTGRVVSRTVRRWVAVVALPHRSV